jgi:4a-hydroxytetrahydrobiopterin dehydratase
MEDEDDQVRERPKHALANELRRHAVLARALEQASPLGQRGILRVVSVAEGWSEVDGALEREFVFDGFLDAIAFVNRLAEAAEAAGHHPDIAISYKHVTVRWSTHSASAITERDREMAERTNTLA